MKNSIFSILVAIGLISCTIEPKPIEYGKDACYYCEMTIVDKIHGAELVTKKGKVYKFDAAECMVYHIHEVDTSEIALYLTNGFKHPEKLIDATKATYLISKQVPSPMGANLSAFNSKEDAANLLAEKGGKLYTWHALLKKMNK